VRTLSVSRRLRFRPLNDRRTKVKFYPQWLWRQGAPASLLRRAGCWHSGGLLARSAHNGAAASCFLAPRLDLESARHLDSTSLALQCEWMHARSDSARP
jgi:hypothetical protein